MEVFLRGLGERTGFTQSLCGLPPSTHSDPLPPNKALDVLKEEWEYFCWEGLLMV
jgi:hypothetical protein